MRRIVVARHDRLGDLVLSLPAVHALRLAYPSARLALLVDPTLAPLARSVEGVDRVIEAAPRGLRRRLREFEADLLVCISRGVAIPWAGLRARIPHRVGSGYRYYSAIFGRRVREHRSGGARHEAEYALSFAHRAGAPAGPARFPLRLSKEVEREAKDWLAKHELGNRFVLLHPGGSGSCPCWPIEHYVRLAALLEGEGLRVALSIGPSDRAVATALEAAPETTRRLPWFTGGLEQLAVLCKRAGLVATNSTGPLHLAAALGTPTLGFFAPWPSCGVGRWGPYAENGWVLVADLEEARRWSRRQRRRRGAALLETIAPDLAASCVKNLLEGRPPQPLQGSKRAWGTSRIESTRPTMKSASSSRLRGLK